MEFRRGILGCLPLLLALTLAAAGTAPARAAWCGENGLVTLSFSEGDSLVRVLDAEPENGTTVVDVWAFLTDVAPAERDGEAFLAVGGFELILVIEGAEAFIVEQEFPIKNINVGQGMGKCIVGFDPGVKLKDGRAPLVRWKVMFQGKPQDVVFRLDEAPGHSCKTLNGCPESGTHAIYIGVETSKMLTAFFGAGQAPAYLNPTGEPDLAPRRGHVGYEEVGIFQRR